MGFLAFVVIKIMFCIGIFARENLMRAISKTDRPDFLEQSLSESLKHGDYNRLEFFSNYPKVIAVISLFQKCYKIATIMDLMQKNDSN